MPLTIKISAINRTRMPFTRVDSDSCFIGCLRGIKAIGIRDDCRWFVASNGFLAFEYGESEIVTKLLIEDDSEMRNYRTVFPAFCGKRFFCCKIFRIRRVGRRYRRVEIFPRYGGLLIEVLSLGVVIFLLFEGDIIYVSTHYENITYYENAERNFISLIYSWFW